jgi:lipopolysaccharide/colanic/teichoic acid biosynthesis glycosyltransferase
MATPSAFSIPPTPVTRHPAAAMTRRALELLACVVALPLLCLTTLVMVATTRLTSPGPVIFRQRRIGFQGREFMLFKFRTMHVGADSTVHEKHFKELVDSRAPMTKLDGPRDRRLLSGGRFLRASGLDELPQLINVLRGEMSLIGPRPCLLTEFAQYLPEQRERVNAVPGLTGLWQVSGKNHTTFEEMIRLDIEYARHASLLLDLKIILLTPVVLAGQIAGLRQRQPAARPAFAAIDANFSKIH